jgi:DNA-binding CsgD family transcriptional regulator
MPVRRSSARVRRARSAVGLDWPGRGEGLSDRKSEILALVMQGKSNAEVAALTYLSPNSSYTFKQSRNGRYRIAVGRRTLKSSLAERHL